MAQLPRLRVIALTRGAQGSTLFDRDLPQGHTLPARQVTVKDTVGAGDAFTAALVAGILKGRNLATMHEHAVEVAAFVCWQSGATPKLPAALAAGDRGYV
jgi:fructokinase